MSGTNGLLLDLPCGRVVISRPRDRVAAAAHDALPNGLPRFRLRRPASVCGEFTCLTQPALRRIGHADSNSFFAGVPEYHRLRLLHRQAAARFTRFARNALSTTADESLPEPPLPQPHIQSQHRVRAFEDYRKNPPIWSASALARHVAMRSFQIF